MGMGLIPVEDPSKKALHGMGSAATTMSRQDRVIKQAEEEKSIGGGLASAGTASALGASVGGAPGAIVGGIVGLLGYYMM